ncbi:putative two-component sensor histidine kinase [Alteromonas sp. 38]|uniref:sensor histidine kinase n=1 Tax=Alteromonas TaxID=226 RepID=UPI0012EFD354|nr:MULTISPECIES: sensor histidine kinase [Alteromonas]CAD5270662.1 putative two-component sensor histidine kinase [Alteromonas sp. 154]VXB93760.1 putative two-component sensor histidine kinase [Alteromonas sp. 38]
MLNKVLSSLYSWVIMVVFVIAIITANSFYVVQTLDDLSALEARLFTTSRVISAVNKLHVAVLRAESGTRGFLLTEDEAYLEEYTETLNNFTALADEVEVSALASDLPQQSQRIEKLLALTRVKINGMVRIVELVRVGDLNQAFTLLESDRGLDLYNDFENMFERIDSSERDIQGTHLASLMKLRRDSVNTLLISSGTTLFLIISIFLLLKANIRENEKHKDTLVDVNEDLEHKISERTQELRIYSDELARSNRELEDFAFVASHDLQEPLRKIRAFGNRLDSGYKDVMDERGQDFLARMLNAAERMSMLISDLLSFSRVSTRGKDFEQVNVGEVIDGVLGDLEIAIEEKGANVVVQDIPTIRADKSQIDQLFLNLLSNALKFQTADKEPLIEITATTPSEADMKDILLADEYDWIKIQISDNGIGFEQSFAEKIFAPFQRLHGRSEYKGTGIGLAVCRRIVERHNGQISAKSSPGKGATFTILLPTNSEPFGSLNNNGDTTHDA